jgi:uncharacterized protein (TIGR02246 family)
MQKRIDFLLIYLSLLIIIFIFFSGCGDNSKPIETKGEDTTLEAAAAIRARIEAYLTVWNSHDPSALAAFFTDDADVIMGNGPITRGRQAIQELWRNYFATQEPERRATLVVDSVRLITTDVALINIATTTGGRNAQGQELHTRKARGTWVLVDQGGEWVIAAMRGMPTEQDRIIRSRARALDSVDEPPESTHGEEGAWTLTPLTPIGSPVAPPVRIDAGESCIVEAQVAYVISGGRNHEKSI